MQELFKAIDIGKRGKNQDAASVRTFESNGQQFYMALVADGVGSLKDSEMASGFAARYFEKYFEEQAEAIFNMEFDELELTLFEKAKELHERLLYIAKSKDYEYGTTLTLALILENTYVVLQVGDSKAFIYQNSVLRQITKDQNVKALKEEGKMTDASYHENTLLQCLGKGNMVPKLYDGILEDEYILILSSDGLCNTLSFEEMVKSLTSNQDIGGRVDNLIQRARRKGEADDISVCVIEGKSKKRC